MLQEDNRWIQSITTLETSGPVFNTYNYILSGDTIINDTSYDKLYAVDDLIGQNESFDLQEAILFAAMRETEDGQVFFRFMESVSESFVVNSALHDPSATSDTGNEFLTSENEYLLCDFSLAVGDTVPNHTRTVESVDSVMLGDNQYHKMIILSPSYSQDLCAPNVAWIEGIGPTRAPTWDDSSDMSMFVSYRCPEAATDMDTYFRCFHSSSYNYPAQGCSQILNINEIDSGNEISIFPNPAVRSLYIELKDNKFNPDQIKILDISGRVVMSQSAGNSTSGPVRFDIEKIPAGVYAVQVLGDNGVIGTTRFIKQ